MRNDSTCKQWGVVLVDHPAPATKTMWVVASFGGVVWNEARFRKWVGPDAERAKDMAARFNYFKDTHLHNREKASRKLYNGYRLD